MLKDPVKVEGEPADLNGYAFRYGQFQVTFRVPEPQPDVEPEGRASAYMQTVNGKLCEALTEEGFKRIYAYRIHQRQAEPLEDGTPMLEIRAKFAVLDNQVWLVPALYALTAGIATVGGWFLIDKIETFTGSTTGTILTVTAAAITAFVLYKSL